MGEQTQGLTIKVVAERTGVSVHTLRAWERRYAIPKPSRDSDNRYRLYDEQDIADVLWLKHQIESGLSPALASALRQQQHSQRPTDVLAPEPRLPAMRTTLKDMLTQSNEAGAQQILDQAFAILAPEQIALEIIEPVMNELGARWQRNEMNVWQEHLASNLIRQRILSFMQSQPAPAPHALSLVAACAPEEQHELGLLLLALLMRRQGWRVTYLGQRTPLGDVLPLLKEHRVAISVSTSTGLTSLVPLLSNKTLRRDHLFFGGYLPNQLPRLREHLPGAFLGINAPEGVRALTTTEPKPNQWTQTNKALRVAMLLQQQRLKLGWQTVENSDFRVHGGQAEYITLQALTQPTLFFVDALISAIAFDVPELVDEQVRWLNKALPPRGVERQPLKEYIETFRRVAHQNLETDTTPQVSMLLDRFQEMFDSGKGDE